MFYFNFKKYLILSLLPIGVIIFFIYILYHSYVSDSGYAKNVKLHTQMSVLQNDLSDLNQEKNKLIQHIKLLDPIDSDMLEEQAKKILYYAHPDEIVIHQN
jgi:cell division protein FtsB